MPARRAVMFDPIASRNRYPSSGVSLLGNVVGSSDRTSTVQMRGASSPGAYHLTNGSTEEAIERQCGVRANDLRGLKLYYEIAMDLMAETFLAEDVLKKIDAHTFFVASTDRQVEKSQQADASEAYGFLPMNASEIPGLRREYLAVDTFVVTFSSPSEPIATLHLRIAVEGRVFSQSGRVSWSMGSKYVKPRTFKIPN
jgi:hypothetical protein